MFGARLSKPGDDALELDANGRVDPTVQLVGELAW
jgi:hypothetical protein